MSDKNNGFIDFSDTSAVNEAMGKSVSEVQEPVNKKSAWLLGLILGVVFAIFLGLVLYFDNYSASHYKPLDISLFETMTEVQENCLKNLQESSGIGTIEDYKETSGDLFKLNVKDINTVVPREYFSLNSDSNSSSRGIKSAYVYYFEDRVVYCFEDSNSNHNQVVQILYGDKDYAYVSEDFYFYSGLFYGMDYINIPIGDKVSFSYNDYVRVPIEKVSDYISFSDWKYKFLGTPEFYNLCDDYFSSFESKCIESENSLSINTYNVRQDRANFKRAVESYNKSDDKSFVNPAEAFVSFWDYIISNLNDLYEKDNSVSVDSDMPSSIIGQDRIVEKKIVPEDKIDEEKESLSKVIKGIEKSKASDYALSDVLDLYDNIIEFLELGYSSLYIGTNSSNMHDGLYFDIRFMYNYFGNFDYEVCKATYNDYLVELVPELTSETFIELDEVGEKLD